MEQPVESQPPPERLHASWNVPGFAHGFLGRRGGISSGPFAELNLSYSVGDEAGRVDRNWEIARASMPAGRVAGLKQVHGAVVHAVSGEHDRVRLTGDGLVTDVPGIVLTILTADCVPILMVDADRRVAAALHAGWRGALAEIAKAGVDAMAALGASPARIRAALGPSIGQCCFEVDEDLAARFAARFRGAESRRRGGRAGKAFLDLRGIVRDQLQACGLAAESIADVGPCTRCASDRYFSRRAAGGAITGLQVSYIGFAAPEVK